MTFKTSFWSPIINDGLKQGLKEHSLRVGLLPLVYTGAFLFGNWQDLEISEEDFYLQNYVPCPLIIPYYLLGGLAVLLVAAVSISASPITLLLDIAVTLLHDGFVKLGELLGVCEIEDSLSLN